MSLNQSSLVVRAFSPDNDRHIRSVIDLFKRSYGTEYPLQNVYRSQFWKAHIGQRFTSLVALLDGVVVAHLAIQPHPHNTATVQLAYPALDPNALKFEEKIRNEFIKRIHTQVQKHNWRIAIDLEVLSPLFRSGFTTPLIESSEVAIIPGYFTAPSRLIKESGNIRINLLVRQKLLDTNQKSSLKLSVPKKHHSICQQLFNSLGFERTFTSSLDSSWSSELTVSADLRPWYMNYYPAHRVTHLFVQPSLIGREHRNILRKLGSDGKTVAAFVNMRDPQSASFCETLEELDFKFSGVMSCFHERENIIYTRSPEYIIDYDDLPSERAKALAHYMENEDWNAVLPHFKMKLQPSIRTLS